jgi:ribosomal subunit interface protein
MKIIIRTKNLELTDDLQKFVDEKIGGLKKFLSILKEGKKTLTETFVELEKETLHHKKGQIFRTEVQIQLPGKKLIAEAKGEDLKKAIVKVKDELQQEIKKYKLKITETIRRSQRKLKNLY